MTALALCCRARLILAPLWWPLTVGLLKGAISVSLGNPSHQGASPGFGDFSLEPIMLDEFTVSNLRVGYDSSDNWSMTVWVNNVFDTFYYKGVAPADGIIAPHYFGFSEPRRVGLDIGYKF